MSCNLTRGTCGPEYSNREIAKEIRRVAGNIQASNYLAAVRLRELALAIKNDRVGCIGFVDIEKTNEN